MNKILTASLVAIMAVTAANAEIATTGYVTKRTGNLEFTGSLANKNLTQAISTLQSEVGDIAGVEGGVVSGEELEEAVSAAIADAGTAADTKIATALEAYTTTTDMTSAIDSAKSAAIADAGTAADTKIQTALADYTNTEGMTSAIATAKGEAVAAAGTAADTKIQTALADYTNTEGMTSAIATAKGEAVAAAGTAADTKIQTALADYTNTEGMTSAIATAKGEAVAAAGTAADTKIQTALADYTNTEGMTSAIATAKGEAISAAGTAADGKIAALDANVAAEANKVITAIVEENGLLKEVTSVQITNDYIADTAAIAKTKLAQGVQDSLDAADNAMQLAALKNDASWTTAGCATAGVICSLVSNGGNLAWEKVVDDSATAAE